VPEPLLGCQLLLRVIELRLELLDLLLVLGRLLGLARRAAQHGNRHYQGHV
jgi:hypothetical protein